MLGQEQMPDAAKQPVYLIVNGIKIGFTAASGVEDTYDLAAGDGKAGIQDTQSTAV